MIQIDMPIPMNCGDCRFCDLKYTDDCDPNSYAYCSAAEKFIARACDGTDKVVSTAICDKAEFCPLEPLEPRVMTLAELTEHRPLWLEERGYSVRPMICQGVASTFVDFIMVHGTICLPADTYGKAWRCWTSEPTAEEREATPWMT